MAAVQGEGAPATKSLIIWMRGKDENSVAVQVGGVIRDAVLFRQHSLIPEAQKTS
jgi:hypothetical protein